METQEFLGGMPYSGFPFLVTVISTAQTTSECWKITDCVVNGSGSRGNHDPCLGNSSGHIRADADDDHAVSPLWNTKILSSHNEIRCLTGFNKSGNAIFEPEIVHAELGTWLRVLAAFDVVMLVTSLWIFESLILD